MSADLQSFSNLLKLFEMVPTSTRGRTFMEVAGYPHYENVCSNILAFFLDASGEHGMETLMLESLFDLVTTQRHPIDLEGFTIEREYRTSKGQRIDLVLKGNTHVIAIENKVYHRLTNDLGHYSETVESLAGADKETSKFVLSPAKLTDPPGHGFLSITYRELWQKVQARIGNHLNNAHPKWLTFLIDFMENSDRFIPSKKMELSESDRFVIENAEPINALLTERDKFLKKLVRQANQLQASLSEQLKEKSSDVWIYQKVSVVMEYQLCGHKIALDQTISTEGWAMGLLGRNEEANKFLQEVLRTWSATSSQAIPLGHFPFKTWPLETELDVLSHAAEETLDDLTRHANHVYKISLQSHKS